MKPTTATRLCCLISPHKACFNCDTRLCARHYNYYSKKGGSYYTCKKYFAGDAAAHGTSGVSGWGYCTNEVCSPCSKKCRVATGSAWCGLHAPDFSPNAPKTYRCPSTVPYGMFTQYPLEDFKKHLETCKDDLDKHYVGIKDVIGLHRPAVKTDI